MKVKDCKVKNQLKGRMSKKWQRTLLKSIGRLHDQAGYRPPNWVLVQLFLTGSKRSTDTHATLHCLWLGFDPDATSF